jgi:hypothetical protein
MINTAGHCTVCHQDFIPNVHHVCGGTPTPCGARCSQRTYFAPVGAGDGGTFVVDTARLLQRVRDLEAALRDVRGILTVPAAEYVPAIPDAWARIDAAL